MDGIIVREYKRMVDAANAQGRRGFFLLRSPQRLPLKMTARFWWGGCVPVKPEIRKNESRSFAPLTPRVAARPSGLQASFAQKDDTDLGGGARRASLMMARRGCGWEA